ncbi:myb-like protein X isoform X4 [Achroia grisella]|uniref:myb-like protein X isoform X4 n=1 Tax=Achroia grisella TaxID=688607 RepID=UPI0027D27AC3|nr:myb-like protein X isoform X4 [Achroia grisella]
MSQKASTRKGGVNEDKEKEKRQTESPVNDIKKKVVANSEKEKQVAEKSTDKTSEKKSEKSNDKTEKNVDKADKKTTEKNAEKKSEAQEKTKEDSSKGEKSGKEKQDEKKDTRKQNGKDVHNGVSNVTNTNGTDEALNGTSKDSKVLKMKDDALTTDRKLRSADSPKPEGKKETTKQTQDSPKKQDPKKTQDNESKQGGDKTDVEIVIDLEDSEEAAGAEESRKTDTNFSKSRVKVSPYRRSGRTSRLADHTASSVMANYTGNNTTMEMDITETSSFVSEDPSLDDSYLSGLRTIRGRRSYKPLKEMALRNIGANRSLRSVASLNSSEQPSRPTGTVVGRKRKQENDEVELGEEAQEAIGDMEVEGAVIGKRRRLLERLAQPFRRTLASTPLPARRAAEIVGINTDLPLSAPVSSGDSFDPESLKASASTPVATPLDNPTVTTNGHDKDSKRCIVM